MSITASAQERRSPQIVTIGGSPALPSRTQQILDYAATILELQGLRVGHIQLRKLPAEALLFGRVNESVALTSAVGQLEAASGIVIATPVYKAAYTGVLKAFLDQLPEGALADKVVLPIVLAGTPAHALVLEYALKPVLCALGARLIADGLFVPQSAVRSQDGQPCELDATIDARLRASLQRLVAWLPLAQAVPAEGHAASAA